jgi:hypothetical protein
MTIALTAKAQQEFNKLTEKQKELVNKFLPKKRKILFDAFTDGFLAREVSDWLLEKLSDDSDAVPIEIRMFYQGLNVPRSKDRTPEELAELRARPENYPNGPFVFSGGIFEQDGTESLVVNRKDFEFFIKQQPNWNKEATHVNINEPDGSLTVLLYRKDFESYLKSDSMWKDEVKRFTIIEPDGSSTTCKTDELPPQ